CKLGGHLFELGAKPRGARGVVEGLGFANAVAQIFDALTVSLRRFAIDELAGVSRVHRLRADERQHMELPIRMRRELEEHLDAATVLQTKSSLREVDGPCLAIASKRERRARGLSFDSRFGHRLNAAFGIERADETAHA